MLLKAQNQMKVGQALNTDMYLLFSHLLFIYWHRVYLCMPGWPRTQRPSCPYLSTLELKACAAPPEIFIS